MKNKQNKQGNQGKAQYTQCGNAKIVLGIYQRQSLKLLSSELLSSAGHGDESPLGGAGASGLLQQLHKKR